MWGPLVRRRGGPALRRERVDTPDGDFVELDWLTAPASPRAPLLLVLHGLEGSARSHYVRGVLTHAHRAGWRGAALNFRSCGGELNRRPRFYHSGDTGDLDHVVRRLVAREPDLRVGVVGVSLGGNVLLKWLGEHGEDAPEQVVATAAISVPFDLEACARVMDCGFANRVYTASFLRTMRRKAARKARVFPGFVDVAAVRRARTFAAYDRAMTAPVHGFADEFDYWRRSSCAGYLAGIRRPTLLINALDDPFVPPAALPPREALPPGVWLEVTPRGGHVGFVDGRWPWRTESWAERRAVVFLAAVVAEPPGGIIRQEASGGG